MLESIPGGSENALQTALASQLKELMSMTTKSTMTLAAASPPHFRSAATLAAAADPMTIQLPPRFHLWTIHVNRMETMQTVRRDAEYSQFRPALSVEKRLSPRADTEAKSMNCLRVL